MNNKLNFGCGARFSPGWENIDFYSPGPEVRRVNLVCGFPYPSASFDAVYSSHVLEHFTKAQCLDMLRECFRVLRTGGVVRVVIPDLGVTIDEYQRIRGMADSDPDKAAGS
jgi:predicted SAM-dependent methyltransferase